MYEFRFTKWEGAGNDFILVDDREEVFPDADVPFVRLLCDRHLGIGSDGLILLRQPRQAGVRFHMEFLNPDGSRSFCGNGSRCAYAAWSELYNELGTAGFTAIDGAHEASWEGPGRVQVTMRDVSRPEPIAHGVEFLDTGSPHLVIWTDDPATVDLVPEARRWRYGDRFGAAGVNVNYVAWKEGRLHMRTYERGVEAETLSCGTGVTAAALSAMAGGIAKGTCPVSAPGGDLKVAATLRDGAFLDVRLTGPVRKVFEGRWGSPER